MSDTNDDGFERKVVFVEVRVAPLCGARVPEGRSSNLRNTHPGCTGDTGAGFGPSEYTKKS